MTQTQHRALWRDITSSPTYVPLRDRVEVDTVIVGAGITGITAAWHLVHMGQRVAVVEMGAVGAGETGKTTAHLTCLMDGGTSALRKKHGDAVARQVVEAHSEAIDFIESLCTEFGSSTRFRRVAAYIYSEDAQGVAQVDAERDSLAALGIGVERLARAPLPFVNQGALRVEHQAQVEPMAYLAKLAADVVGSRGQIFTNSRALHVEDGAPCKVITPEGEVKAQTLIMACHTPLNRLAYHTQIFAYRTYALAASCASLPPPGLYFDTADPYHYIRLQDTPGGEVLIVGGNDHKTGQQQEDCSYLADLAKYAQDRFAIRNIDFTWSGQIMEPADMLPFIGPNGRDQHTLFASGYSGNGITFGTMAGRLLADLAVGRENRHAKVFSSRRHDVLAQLAEMARENVDVPVHMIGDRLAALTQSEKGLRPGEARLVNRGGKPVALYRDASGTCHTMSAVCPHMGCLVKWNREENSWDCPCHGSRFNAEGKLLNGPSSKDLQRLDPINRV